MNNPKQLKCVAIGFRDYGEKILEDTIAFANSNSFLKDYPKGAMVYNQLAAELFIIIMEEKLQWLNLGPSFKRIKDCVVEILWLDHLTKAQYDKFEETVLNDVLDTFNDILIWMLKDRQWHRFDIVHRKIKRMTHSLIIRDLGDHRILHYHEMVDRSKSSNALESDSDESSFDLINSYVAAMQAP